MKTNNREGPLRNVDLVRLNLVPGNLARCPAKKAVRSARDLPWCSFQFT